ncbi:glycosyltransferase family 4 protein [Rheinheimera nanhaiensis]|uniref:N-acetyllactosaminide 3-alpha-galactosyltransferase n=1 Tax=Rheinheimera nanhaiensis E407-8 TaxID=562729 RepID=I1DTN8_9GAMM|nr:glycosyltransferase family 4 protein [Rheinheimera nanhaiensis]GAB57416.1 N-acetyllactosaminide 3-alpha-galactosyltransferase [Rheinheimera nanhaiensis E407-8]
MQSHNLNLLIVSNMGPKPSSPFQGKFVHNQVWALAALNPAYHYMRWHSDSRLNKVLKYPVFLLDFIWRFILSRRRFDIIHVHFFYPTIYLALLYKWLRNSQVKIVVTCHGSDIYKYQPPGKLYRWCAAKVDQWIFASKALAQHFSLPVAKKQVLPAGISELFRQTDRLSYQEKSIDLLYVGSLDQNKGMDRLLALLPVLHDKKVVVAGSGPWLARLQHAAQQFPNVLVVGPKDTAALKQLYCQARGLISLSRHEAFGLVMAEAMACYTPVIATETDGAREQVQHGINGLLVSQQGEETEVIARLSSALQQFFSLSEQQYQLLQQQGRASAEQYLLGQVVTELQQVYQRVML